SLELSKLAAEVAATLQKEDVDIILNPARQEEYQAYCSVLVLAHASLGGRETFRPKNRHVVTHHTPAELALLEGKHRPTILKGKLVYIALPQSDWKGGAWVGLQSGNFDLGTQSEAWNASCTLEIPDGTPIFLERVEVIRPSADEFFQPGLTLKFTSISADE